MTDWIYKGECIADIAVDCVGFIYCITNLLDGRKYFGKKKATFRKTSIKTVKLKNGTKKKKKIRSNVPSDWATYYGSSTELQADVEKLGKENFTREILRFCDSLSSLSYYESKIQFETDCLLYPDKYYNSWISSRVRRDHLLKSTHKTEHDTIISHE